MVSWQTEFLVEGLAAASATIRLLSLAVAASTRTINMWFAAALAFVSVAYASFNLLVGHR